MIHWDDITVWWHITVLKHHVRQDISPTQMITWCSCTKVWVTT